MLPPREFPLMRLLNSNFTFFFLQFLFCSVNPWRHAKLSMFYPLLYMTSQQHDLRDDRGSSGRRESSSHREKPRNRSPSPSSSDQSDEDNSRRGHTRRRDSSRDRPHSRSPRPHSKFSRDNSSTKGHKRNDDDRYWDNQTKSRQEGRDRR